MSIDSYGTVTALKEGTATLTVSLKENPKNVKPLSIKVKVGAKTFVTALSFDYQADSRIHIEKVEDEGSEAAYIGYDLITVRSSLVNAQEKKLVVTPIGIDSEGDSIIVPYTWSCLDTNIVQLSSTATTGKSNTLTLKKGVVGETVITVKTKQVAKGENAAEVERKFIIRIVDDTPRLAEDELVADPLSDTGTPIELVSNYENEPELTDVKIVELITNTKPISYSDEKIKDVFEIVLEDGKLYLKAKNPEKYTAKKNYSFKNCYLQGTLQGTGKIYQIPITSLTICKKEIKPAFSISGKLNLFYNGYAKEEEIGKVTVTSKNKDLTIERCELVGIDPQTDIGKTDDGKFANNFTITPTPNDGKLYITRTQNDMATYDSGNSKGKPVLSGYIKINYVGYDSNFYYKITVPTSTVAPTYTLAPATITLNSLAENQVKTVQFINKKTKKPENITADTVITMDRSDSGTTVNVKEIETDDINIDSDTVTLHFEGFNTKNGQILLNLRQPSWENQTWNTKSAVKAKVIVKVTSLAPTAKLSKTTLNLNTACPQVEDSATITLNQEDAELIDTQDFAPKGRKTSENLEVRYEDGKVYAAIKDGTTVDSGSYQFTYTPSYNFKDVTTYPAKAVTFTVKVTDTAPSISLKNKTFNINANCYSDDGKHDKVTTTFKCTNLPTEYAGYDFDTTELHLTYTGKNPDPLGSTAEQWDFNIAAQRMTVELSERNYGTSKYMVEGLKLEKDGEYINIKPFAITVCGKNTTPTVTVSAKGTINPLDPQSKVTFTPKLTNVSGKVDGVKLIELTYLENEPMPEGTEHFDYSFDPVTGKTDISVKADETLEKRSYRVKLYYTIENAEGVYAVAKDQIITPKQTLPKVKTDKTSIKLFAGNKEKCAEIKLTKTGTVTADIDQILINEKTKSYALIKDAFEEPQYDPNTETITIKLKNSALIKQNVTQELILETHCKGQLQDTTGTTFKVKVTVIK